MSELKKWTGYSALYAVEKEKERATQEEEKETSPEPLRKMTGVENRTPSEIDPRTPSVLPEPPLRSEPVGKTEPLQKPEGVKLLPKNAAHLRIPYEVWEGTLRKLKPAERVVLEELYRASAGWQSDECVISIAKLCEYTNIEATQVRQHLKRLEGKGLIERKENIIGGSDLSARGVRFRVLLTRLTPSENRTPSENQPPRKSEPNKEKLLKKDYKEGSASPDHKDCPTCHGTGFWYPEGVGRGVAKCIHDREAGE